MNDNMKPVIVLGGLAFMIIVLIAALTQSLYIIIILCYFGTAIVVYLICALPTINKPGSVDENGFRGCEDDPDPLLACEEFEDSEVQK